MTDAAETLSLYITDAELIRRMGVPEKVARETLRMLDRNPRQTGFPQKSKIWGDRRYWPAVKAYLDRANGVVPAPETVRRKVHDPR